MTNETYNGWTNRETWLVNLWLTNDEITYNRVRELNVDELGAFVEAIIDDKEIYGFLADLINSALSRVDWKAIAESLAAD